MSICIFNQQRDGADEAQNTATSPMLQRWQTFLEHLMPENLQLYRALDSLCLDNTRKNCG
jgi:hypothetical protein